MVMIPKRRLRSYHPSTVLKLLVAKFSKLVSQPIPVETVVLIPPVFFVLTVAAAEAAIGLAILIVLFRTRRSINVQDLDRLKG